MKIIEELNQLNQLIIVLRRSFTSVFFLNLTIFTNLFILLCYVMFQSHLYKTTSELYYHFADWQFKGFDQTCTVISRVRMPVEKFTTHIGYLQTIRSCKQSVCIIIKVIKYYVLQTLIQYNFRRTKDFLVEALVTSFV